MKSAILALADGTVLKGQALGFAGETIGEVVFNTAMTGYQEILTDPSYKGQIVLMTSSQIGNYGVTPEDNESRQIWAEGFIVREASKRMSNWRGRQTLEEYLLEHKIVGIQGVDTRALTNHLRKNGSQMGIISHVDFDEASLCAKALSAPSIVGRDLVREVSCDSPYQWSTGSSALCSNGNNSPHCEVSAPFSYKIVVMDFGVKNHILRSLVDIGCVVEVVPASTSEADIRERQPDGVFLSNGPGDPEGVPYAVNTVKALLGWKPIFGICLGHQILGLSLGLPTHKLLFGHHGANHPVIDLRTRKIEITSQNHNFAVDLPHNKKPEEVPWATQPFDTSIGKMEVTHRSLNDGCCEGMIGLDNPILSVQYHPEASPGPHDSSYLFQQFIDMMKGTRNG